ncbi:polysaccharide deacetylase family protein [Duganella aceris]|uniref:Polysaccharide deacetylase family protein n=1 Tax=Duganella aceris TaxID=2703883 RepID=A0ABX0FRY9_9BURK|nr:polysaccharide deacetylase family protein [Duganella aceris]NGZ87109.1 polysaccharide deacetylase family protein [Duganella aceris]
MTPRLSILIYHRVLARPDPLLPSLPDVRRFDRQMTLLKRCFRVLSLAHAARRLQDETLPARAACITFDDGYADNVALALPVLRRHGLHATFFIASGYLDGGQMWNDDVITHVRRTVPGTPAQQRATLDHLLGRLKYLPFDERQAAVAALTGAPSRGSELMMRSCQVRALLDAGMDIGAHTHRHPILAAIPDRQALAEIAEGKAALEAIARTPVTLFAYPNGKPGVDYTQRHVDMVNALGFEAAVSTSPGAAYPGSDVLQLPRFTPWEQDLPRFLLRLLESRMRAV